MNDQSINQNFIPTEPTGGFGCTENQCPVMRCNPQCCYDGCRSFCQGFQAEPTAIGFREYYDYDYDYAGGAAQLQGYLVLWSILSVGLTVAYFY